jgi:light-regulated signal transduction histidine kinase (bacteriophytochrome)
LLSNAVKYTPEYGKVHLLAFIKNEDDKSITLQTEIADNGIGISKDQQRRIFDVFTQKHYQLPIFMQIMSCQLLHFPFVSLCLSRHAASRIE